MATITATEHIQDPDNRTVGYLWTPVTENDTCAAVKILGHDDMTVTVHGTMGGASLALHLSNEGAATGFVAAKDVNTGVAIALVTADTSALVSETGVWFQPVLTGGTSQSATVTLVGK